MPLIWRGMGIAVPIIFFITGLLVSWISGDPDTRLGNPSFIGWTSLWSGIVIFLLGLAALGMGEGEDEAGNKVKKKHDFFYVPIVVWGLLLGGLSVYLLVFTGKAAPTDQTTVPSDTTETVVTEDEELPTTRVVHFFNPTKDSMRYVIGDEKAEEHVIGTAKVPPMSFASEELEEGSYLFYGYNKKKETTLEFNDKEYTSDESKYEALKDDKGTIYQRILGAKTKENDDYDEAWVVLDGKTDFMLVNVTTACDPSIKEADVKVDWTQSIQEEYDSRDLIEPLYKMYQKGKNIKVVGPTEKLPTKIADNDIVYLLVPYSGKVDKKAVITKAVIAARF